MASSSGPARTPAGGLRRAYFTGPGALDRTLQRFRRFHNFEQPHHGYRVRGRTPVFGVHAVAG
jgi:hypothetical protein